MPKAIHLILALVGGSRQMRGITSDREEAHIFKPILAPMTTKELKEKLNGLEEKMQSKTLALDGLLLNTEADLVDSAHMWIMAQYNGLSSANSVRINAMVEDGSFDSFKAEYSTLRESLPGAFKPAQQSISRVPHKDIQLSRGAEKMTDEYFDLLFRKLISGWGALLHAHKMLNSEPGIARWQQLSDKSFRYTINHGVDIRSKGSVQVYRANLNELIPIWKDWSEAKAAYEISKANDALHS